jgi:hypothetical protein
MKRFLVVLLPVLFLTSCSRRININTYADMDSLPIGFPKGASFFILTKSENDAFLAKEITKKIGKILTDKGYRIADEQSAQYFLYFDFHMQSEKRSVTNLEEVGKTVVSSYGTAYEHGNANAYGYGNGTVYGDVNGHWHNNASAHASYNGSSHYNNQTVANQMAYIDRVVTFFYKELILQIFDANAYRSCQEERKVWESVAYNLDESGDLRSCLDFILIASFEYLGKNSQKLVCVELNDGDRKVKNLRKSYLNVFECREVRQKVNIKAKFNQFIQQAKNNFSKMGNSLKSGFDNLFRKKDNKTPKKHPKSLAVQ